MFRTQPRGTHRAPGPAVIDYRGLAAPVGRGVGGVAIVGAVTATAAFSGAESARALTHSPAGIDAMRGVAPALAPSAPTTTYNNVKLRLGARGAAVKHLQTRLNAHGASLAVDGVFGSATLRAVKNHQSASRIGVDGVVGPKTWNTLNASGSSSSQPKLRQGDRGQAVRTLQTKLNERGASLAVDGSFGPATRTAVRSLQSAAGISVDGVVGPQTWNALNGSTTIGGGDGATAGPGTQPKLRQGDRGQAVRTLQTKLNERGASLAVDGSFGPATRTAVRSLQSAAGISVDGVVGPQTWNALNGSTTIGGGDGGTSVPGTQPKLRQGDRGQAVRTLQTKLNERGASLAVDGSFGPATRTAVRSLQSAAGISVDGAVGPQTWKALNGSTTIGGGGGSDGSFSGQAIVNAARAQIGVRYVWGGHSPSGFDCSGLVHYAYNQAGVNLPRKTAKGYALGGKVIPASQAQPGDLVAFTSNNYGHMGIYAGGGKIIDASNSRQRVVERSIWNAPHVFVSYR